MDSLARPGMASQCRRSHHSVSNRRHSEAHSGGEWNILIGIFVFELFDMVSLPVILSTFQVNQIFGKVDIIGLIPVELSSHPGCLPIDLSQPRIQGPGRFLGETPFFFKILK